MIKYIEFRFPYTKSETLISGHLIVFKSDGSNVAFPATTGILGKQTLDDLWQDCGPIPPTDHSDEGYAIDAQHATTLNEEIFFVMWPSVIREAVDMTDASKKVIQQRAMYNPVLTSSDKFKVFIQLSKEDISKLVEIVAQEGNTSRIKLIVTKE